MNTTPRQTEKSPTVSEQKYRQGQQQYMETGVVNEDLSQVRQQELDELYQDIQSRISAEIDKATSSYYENCQLIESSINEVEMEARLRADASFQNLQGEHIKELIQVEKQYALEIIRAKTRLIPAVENLKRKATTLSKIGNTAESRQAEQEAQKEKENEIKRRKAEVDKAFDSTRKTIFTRQRSELSILDEKLKAQLNQITTIKEAQMKSQLQKLKVAIQSILAHSCDVIPNHLNNPKNKTDIMKKLQGFANEKLKEICNTEEDIELPTVIDQATFSTKKISKYPLQYFNSANETQMINNSARRSKTVSPLSPRRTPK